MHLQHKMQLDGDLVIALAKINAASKNFGGESQQACFEFVKKFNPSEDSSDVAKLALMIGGEELERKLISALITKNSIKDLPIVKFLDFMINDRYYLGTVGFTKLKAFNDTLLKNIEDWLDYIQDTGKANVSDHYLANIAPVIESAAYRLHHKFHYHLFRMKIKDDERTEQVNEIAHLAKVLYDMFDISRKIFIENNINYGERASYAMSIRLRPLFSSENEDQFTPSSSGEIVKDLMTVAEYYFGQMPVNLVINLLNINPSFNKFTKPGEDSTEVYVKNVLAMYFNGTSNIGYNNSSVIEFVRLGDEVQNLNSIKFDQYFAGKLIDIANNSITKNEAKGDTLGSELYLLYLANYLVDRDYNPKLKIAIHKAFSKVIQIANGPFEDVSSIYAYGHILEAKRISEQYGLEYDFDKLLLKSSVLMCAKQDNDLHKYLCSAVVLENYKDSLNQLFDTAKELGVDTQLFDANLVKESINEYVVNAAPILYSQKFWDHDIVMDYRSYAEA